MERLQNPSAFRRRESERPPMVYVGFSLFIRSVTSSTHSIPHHASTLKCSYRALYSALNEPSMSDLFTSIEYEIRKDVAVLASLEGLLIEKWRVLTFLTRSNSYRESLRLRNLRLSLCELEHSRLRPYSLRRPFRNECRLANTATSFLITCSTAAIKSK